MLGYKAALRGAINSEYKFKLKEIKSVISHPKVNEKFEHKKPFSYYSKKRVQVVIKIMQK